jgi:CubicO group peptidase (beta-lactamase class C family)
MAKIPLLRLLLGVLFTLCALSSAHPIGSDAPESSLGLRSEQLQVRGVPEWYYYYGIDAATYQTIFNKLSPDHRIISISVYGTPPSVTYAVVWVKRAGPAWVAIHGADATTYQNWFDTNAAQGYVSTLVSVTGPAGSPIYMGVMEKIAVSSWFQLCGITATGFADTSNTAYGNGQILKAFREFGDPSDRRYCGLWHSNPNYVRWDLWETQPFDVYQQTFNSELTKPGWRASYVTISEDHQISSLFTDTYVGSWVARDGLTGSELQAETAQQGAAGRYLINLQGGGPGGDALYTAIWAEQDIPQSRAWTVTGPVNGFKNIATTTAHVDGLVQSFMQSNGVRQAQIAIAKNGNLLLSRAYSWQEPVRTSTQPDHTFLLASISKMFLEAAVQTLYNDGKLLPTTRAYPLLGYTHTPDPRLSTITIQQLLDHSGGLNDTLTGFDPLFAMRQIALIQHPGTDTPASVKDVVDFMSEKPLDFAPGTGTAYSNYGYLLLSYVVEHVTGLAYYNYLSAAVLKVGGSYDVREFPTAGSAHVNDPVIQENAGQIHGLGLSALNPASPDLVATTFGGDGIYKESAYGVASLAASAQTLASFIHSHGRSSPIPVPAALGIPSVSILRVTVLIRPQLSGVTEAAAQASLVRGAWTARRRGRTAAPMESTGPLP